MLSHFAFPLVCNLPIVFKRITGWLSTSNHHKFTEETLHRHEFTRECLAIDVAGRIRSAHVIEQLARVISVHGAPGYLRSDNGSEFVSRAVLKWLTDHRINTAFIDPGKPWQNGLDESFNGKFRDECLNMEWFRSRAEAKVIIEAWRRQYNQIRPHSSLNYFTPNEFIQQLSNEASTTAEL